MKMEEKLVEIENLLADLYNSTSLLQEELIQKYEYGDNNVSDEEYLNDKGCVKFWIKSISEFLGKKYD